MKLPRAFLWFVLGLSIEGCMHNLREKDGLSLAKSFAEQNGRKTEDYNLEPNSNNGIEYEFFFQGKNLRPGNHFVVLVNKKTGKCRIIEGR
jgi:hypothetical protein